MEEMKRKSEEIKDKLQGKKRKFKHTMGVNKKVVHYKAARDKVEDGDADLTSVSDERAVKEHPSYSPLKLEHILSAKEFTKIRNDAYFQYLVHWKGVSHGDATGRPKNDRNKHEPTLQHCPQGNLSSFFPGSMVQGT